MKGLYTLTLLLVASSFSLSAQTKLIDLAQPYGMVKDGDNLYVAEYGLDKIITIDLSVSPPTKSDLLTAISVPSALVHYGNALYVGDIVPFGISKIHKVNLTGTPTLTEIAGRLNSIAGLAVYGSDLYASESGGNKVIKFDLSVDPPTKSDFIGISEAIGLVVHGDDLYVASAGADKVYKVNLVGTPAKTEVVTGLNNPFALAVHGDNLYIAESGANKISRADLNASLPTTATAVGTASYPWDLLLDGDILYISERTGGKISTIDLATLSSQAFPTSTAVFVSPNPAGNSIRVSGLKTQTNYQIYTLLGAEVQKGNLSENEEIDIQDFTNGVYFLTLENGTSLKFIKE